MGYTHYFKGLKTSDVFAEGVRDIVTAAAELGIKVCGPDGYGDPIVTADFIALNGDAEANLDYESFVIRNNDRFNFCKTARRPYDAVVTAILIWAIVGEFDGYENIGTDGSWEDWVNPGRHDGTGESRPNGFEVYEQAFGEKLTDEEIKRVKEVANL